MSLRSKRAGWNSLVLDRLLALAYHAPWATVIVALVTFALCLLLAFNKLEFQSDRAALVDLSPHYQKLSDELKSEFPGYEDTVVVIDGGSTKQRERFCDELAKRLDKTGLYADIFTRVQLPFLRHQALLYLEPGDLKAMQHSLQEAQGMVGALSGQNGVGELLAETSHDLEKMLPVLNEVLGQLLKSLKTRGRYQYESPWEKAFFSQGEAQKPEDNRAELMQEAGRTGFYNTLADGRIHLLLAKPKDDVSAAIKTLRDEVKRLKPAYPELDTGITGELVLDEDEMVSSIGDSIHATLWSMVLVMLLFWFSFKQRLRPAMALFALTMALGWTLGFTTLALGHLNLLTVTFATMLIGLGVDFGIHFIYGYEEERARKRSPLEAMRLTMEHAGIEGLTGAATTAIAFYAICFTDFRGVAELGLIAGTGVILCFISMATVLPALFFLHERTNPRPIIRPRPRWARWLAVGERVVLAQPFFAVAICALFTIWCALRIPEVTFDYNLLHLQSQSLQSVQTELKLLRSDQGLLFAIVLADDLDQAEKLSDKFSQLKTVAKVESIVPLVPKGFAQKNPLLKQIVKLMQSFPLPDANGPNTGSAGGLMKMGEGFTLLESTFRAQYPKLLASPNAEVRRNAKQFRMLLDTLFATLEHMGAGPISDSVTVFQQNLFTDLRGLLEFLKDQQADKPITLKDLPKPVAIRSLGAHGKILVRIYPKGNPWERSQLDPFLKEIQSVSPDVFGTPVLVYYHTEALKRAYEVSGWYAFGAICVVLLLHFRNIGSTLLALLPKVVGVIWMLGIMSYCGVQFNPANFMALPLILGIGLIFGVHVVHRLLHSPREGIFSHSTGPAIALSACTTIACFGTLTAARHQGVASLGFLMTVGVGANLVTSVLLLPALMRLRRPR